MIVVDEKRCRGCGLCARICHEQCIVLQDGSDDTAAEINHALCSTCTQCIAICPQQALSWDGVPPVAHDITRLPSAGQLEELFKQRRTIRMFRPDKLNRSLVEEIVGYGIYAPTNNYALRAILVDDPATIDSFDAIIMQAVARLYNLFFRSEWAFSIARAITPAVDPKLKVKMKRGLERGRSYETRPAAVVFVVGDRRIPLSEASAHYALYTMILYAQARGVGSRIKSAGPMSLDRSSAARKRLGLQRREHILGTLELGWPAVRFTNKVEGKTMSIQWNERRLDD
jgi:nitroreductase/NAD-dependent dihydropyrimidine dehydrogenase PreA subunit